MIEVLCDECDYQTGLKGELKRHKEYIHEGINTNVTSVIFRQYDRTIFRNIKNLSMKV